ncbi:hypothetical protein CTER_1547 [Ruminiclostridium cellobioparum subsp. termitidis CT1112]|uniref:Uncharacterized protein n=1 Tax=Ruminiclostridium cellobioparum subsp. termitidis CT1112 TaxID=1195236 RepID=S0FQY5_RUMCE|nr:hypothetical protein CTER_1547 [Ruminiclostridium cellobioparum subsp. termitidis CT1112]
MQLIAGFSFYMENMAAENEKIVSYGLTCGKIMYSQKA